MTEKILKDVEDVEEEGSFLVLYAFKRRAVVHFYKNMKRVFSLLEDGSLIQKSVVKCRLLKTAQAVKGLAEHFGAKALIFRAEELRTGYLG